MEIMEWKTHKMVWKAKYTGSFVIGYSSITIVHWRSRCGLGRFSGD